MGQDIGSKVWPGRKNRGTQSVSDCIVGEDLTNCDSPAKLVIANDDYI